MIGGIIVGYGLLCGKPELKKAGSKKECLESSPKFPLRDPACWACSTRLCIPLTLARFCLIMVKKGIAKWTDISPSISVRSSRETWEMIREPTRSFLAASKGNTG